jgi:hypothetical protein
LAWLVGTSMSTPRTRSDDGRATVLAAVLATTDRPRWLCEFVNRDLTDAPEAELERLRWAIQAFTYQRPGTEVAPELLRRPPNTRSSGATAFLLHDAAAVRGAHRRLQAGLQTLMLDGEWNPDVKGSFGLRRANNGRLVMFSGGTPEVAFDFATCELLGSLGTSFAMCHAPHCGRFYIARRRQMFCGTPCSQRVRTARFQSSHPDRRAEQKHEAYARKRRAKLGKAVAVRRRPRQRGERTE